MNKSSVVSAIRERVRSQINNNVLNDFLQQNYLNKHESLKQPETIDRVAETVAENSVLDFPEQKNIHHGHGGRIYCRKR